MPSNAPCSRGRWTFWVLPTVAFAAALTLLSSSSLRAQDSPPPLTIRVDSSLTVVDVVAENRKSGLRTRELLTDLKREDFRVFDNGHEMPIESFDIGAEHATRPIALWLIVQCSDDQPVAKHSMFIHGKAEFLRPALAHLAANDVVGVAHWCDDGDARLDLSPGHDPDAALAKIEEILSAKPAKANDRPGELVMQRMIRLMLKDTRETVPRRLPLFLFLYGDGAATREDEANIIATDLLETSGIVYGINDGKWPFDPSSKDPWPTSTGMQMFYLVHYYSRETGGEVYSTVDAKLFSSALDYILTQLHLRYANGFKPLKVDGKRHSLRVELTAEAKKRLPAAELRYRPEYIPAVSGN